MDQRFMRILPLALFCVIFALFLNASYPLLGEDYLYYFPRLLIGKWHFLQHGFFPLRYIVHLCGGIPQYGNPQDYFYSLPQILSLFLNLWPAALISTIVFLILGYVGWWKFAKDVMKLDSAWSHVLAIIVVSFGYHFMHAIAGHLAYQSTPMIGWLLWILFATHRGRTSLILRSILFGLLSAYMLYSGGYFVVITAIVLIAAILPFWLLLEKRGISGFLMRFLGCIAITAALCASKLAAVYSMMRFFPRHIDYLPLPESASNMPMFILKSFFGFPQGWGLFNYEKLIHEYSMFLSPLVLIGVLSAAFFFLRDKNKSLTQKISLTVVAIIVLILLVQLASGSGLFILLKELPVLSSIRITMRFLYIPGILMSIAGVWGLRNLGAFSAFKKHSGMLAFGASFLTVILFYASYASYVNEPIVDRTFPYDRILENLAVHPDYLKKPVTKVEDWTGAQKVIDVHYVTAGTTGISCYEPILAGNTFLEPLVAGPVDTEHDGAFNLYNPACMQYPEENGCRPGDRIALTDKENLDKFAHGETTTWKISIAQRIADSVTLASLFFSSIALGYMAIKRKMK
jgi:hypothetical protein